jgi:hypothetical protein
MRVQWVEGLAWGSISLMEVGERGADRVPGAVGHTNNKQAAGGLASASTDARPWRLRRKLSNRWVEPGYNRDFYEAFAKKTGARYAQG